MVSAKMVSGLEDTDTEIVLERDVLMTSEEQLAYSIWKIFQCWYVNVL